MRAVHLALALFCHVLLASVVFHFTSLVAASPLFEQHQHHKSPAVPAAAIPVAPQQQQQQQQPKQHAPVIVPEAQQQAKVAPAKETLEQKSAGVQHQRVQQAAVAHQKAPEAHVQPQPPKSVEAKSGLEARSAVPAVPVVPPVPVVPSKPAEGHHQQAPSISQARPEQPKHVAKAAEPLPVLSERKAEPVKEPADRQSSVEKKDVKPEEVIAPKSEPAPKAVVVEPEVKPKHVEQEVKQAPVAVVVEPKKPIVESSAPTSPLANQQVELVQPPVVAVPVVPKEGKLPAVPQPAALVAAEPQVVAPVSEPVRHEAQPKQPEVVPVQAVAAAAPVPSRVVVEQVVAAPAPVQEQQVVVPIMPDTTHALVGVQQSPASPEESPAKVAPKPVPVVMGGLGPLHLLATTLCSYQVDKLVADENLNQLYARRASIRKSLFEFMSLKFTNLEKLSSRLGYGLQVVPVKSPEDNKAPGLLPSHGWPVVGKCTAHDLKLMGEAAWCECNDSEQGCAQKQQEAGENNKPAATSGTAKLDEQPPRITSNQHRVMSARSIDSTYSFLPSPEESSVISKILHVNDIKDAPTVESSIYNLNLTQHQLATLEAHATSTQECRRNALRYTKALFNHLAEDQKSVSESWPRLYALISADECARKRMIDIVNALSGFRTDTTSIRRDNLEFAFAMDDLRSKVLESEVNVPLTFDRHFIEVEQFLQQSVRLMLANVQPKRAKLTSMRYRSLMYGNQSDEQCIDLHQRLLSRNYPNDCNPTQFGQLPDVLRMTASSLELWSIEKELSMQTAKVVDYPNSNPAGQQKVKEDVNECIANLVSS